MLEKKKSIDNIWSSTSKMVSCASLIFSLELAFAIPHALFSSLLTVKKKVKNENNQVFLLLSCMLLFSFCHYYFWFIISHTTPPPQQLNYWKYEAPHYVCTHQLKVSKSFLTCHVTAHSVDSNQRKPQLMRILEKCCSDLLKQYSRPENKFL